MKPYVNFIELDKNKKVQKAMKYLEGMLFPNCRVCLSGKICLKHVYAGWEIYEGLIINKLKLEGKDKALFLGHSQAWAGHSLI